MKASATDRVRRGGVDGIVDHLVETLRRDREMAARKAHEQARHLDQVRERCLRKIESMKRGR